jgi:gluconate 2-dehydrogenase subunit 3-like protein
MMDRRAALQLIGLGVAATRAGIAQQHLHALQAQPEKYQLQFFTPAEDRLIDQIAEMILPADGHSPGASAARVSKFIDLVAANSPAGAQAAWKAGVAAMGNFLDRSPADRKATLDKLSAAQNPATPAERFFADMKRTTIFAYYTSRVGLIQELEYKGNSALAEFPACHTTGHSK